MHKLNDDLLDEPHSENAIPARSRLYHLPPCGVGTGQSESLLSYLHRLSQAHCVRPFYLMSRVVLPGTNIRKRRRCQFLFARKGARTINGYTKYAAEVSRSLGTLTARSGLESATFLPWRNLFRTAGSGLLHPTRTWCPCCLANAKSEGEPLYYPLLWDSSSVTCCPIHMVPLECRCFKCKAVQKPICDNLSLGCCGVCNASLARHPDQVDRPVLSQRQRFAADAVADMIAAAAATDNLAKPELLANGLQYIAEAHSNGDIRQLAKSIGVDPKLITAWIAQTRRPSFARFIEVCYRIGTRPLDLLRMPGHYVACTSPARRAACRLTSEQLCQMEAEIHAMVQGNAMSVTAVDLAAKYGALPGTLRYWLPDAYRKLIAHRRHLGR